jgi:hypothetical protein
MPHLGNSEENTHEILALHAVNREGQLFDPTLVEFVVYDWDSGSRVQVFPSSGREDVSAEGDYTGVFPAKDIALDIGITPGTSWGSVNEGKHSIKWWYTDPDTSTATIIWEQVFYISAVDLAMGVWSYVSPNELRTEGLSAVTVPDAWMLELLIYAQTLIDRRCRQPFRPVYETFKMDGTGSTRIHLPVPIIGIDHLKVNASTQELGTGSWHAYASPINRKGPTWLAKDWRRNPKIEMTASPSIYEGGAFGHPGIFSEGAANQDIAGVFGFLEPDGTTPAPIRRATMAMVFSMAERLTAGSSSSSSSSGTLKKLTVDRHSQEWDTASSSVGLTDALALTPEIEAIIRNYRAPISISVV